MKCFSVMWKSSDCVDLVAVALIGRHAVFLAGPQQYTTAALSAVSRQQVEHFFPRIAQGAPTMENDDGAVHTPISCLCYCGRYMACESRHPRTR